jgi:hypothetical protein
MVILPGYGQLNNQLCKPNEKVAFAFQLSNQKWVSVCKEKEDRYIVYRFGTKNKLELQYPASSDTNSWRQFTINGYMRGGGKANAAMNFAYLTFSNNGVTYEVYETWSSEDNKEHCGVNVTIGGKTTDLKGLLKTRKGDLLSLWYDGKVNVSNEH